MTKTMLLATIAALILLSCARSRRCCPPSSQPAARARTTPKPPPTRVRYFNASTKTVFIKQDGGIIFNLKDNGDRTDAWGDNNMTDKALKNGDLTIEPSGGAKEVWGTADLNSPVTGAGGNTNVDDTYRTLSGLVTAKIGGTANLKFPFALPAGHAAGDITGADMLITVQTGSSANKVIVTIWFAYRHSSKWHATFKVKEVTVS